MHTLLHRRFPIGLIPGILAGCLVSSNSLQAAIFELVSPAHTATLLVPESEPECVRLAAEDLASDTTKITGRTPVIVPSADECPSSCVVLASLNRPASAALLETLAPGFGNVLRGKWEAYRSLNWVTYCSDADGRATESPYALHIASWWSDCYGECPRMFYHAFAAMPEWAPPREDHILYSYAVLTDVSHGPGEVRYTARDAQGTEYLRLSYLPSKVTLDEASLGRRTDSSAAGWSSRELGGGDHAVTIRHARRGQVRIANE